MRDAFILAFAVLFVGAVALSASIDWCGNVYPNYGAEINAEVDLNVYFQLYKAGVTDTEGRGEGLSATLFYRNAGEVEWSSVEMAYNVDVGNNDEYAGTVPSDVLTPGVDIELYCEGLDSTDMTTCQGNDQLGNPATMEEPLVYHPVSPTAVDVTVYFSVNMNWVGAIEPVTVAGSFNGWDMSATVLSDRGDGVYTGFITIPAGSNRHQEYKYVNGGTWEATGNRVFEVDDSAPHDQYLPLDYWENRSTLPVSVVFQVNMTGYTVSDPYIAGNQLPLHWGWDDGWTEDDRIYDDGTHCDITAGDNIYTTVIDFPTGTYRDIEYKYTTDGTDNEPLPPYINHAFTLDESSDTLRLPVDTFGSLGITVDRTKIPESIELFQNSPNPFNERTEIQFAISRGISSPATLSVYNLKGELVAEIITGIYLPGIYHITWDASGIPSGTYIYKLEGSDFSYSRKMTLLK